MRPVWDENEWRNLESETLRAALAAPSDRAAWVAIARRARTVLRAYSTSFFLVTRFLPREKRAQVEAIYAAVRFPDEIVDTFPLECEQRLDRLEAWHACYERALNFESVGEALRQGIPCFVAAFARVVRVNAIPAEHYRAFLAAMRMDAQPLPFETLDDLIESYIHGSATVVGYFLAYVYGPSAPHLFERALTSARQLAIALQLTNFLRDVREDYRRGRVYLPLDHLRREGLSFANLKTPGQSAALDRVVRRLSFTAEGYYARAERDLDAFAPDSRTAIRACIDVYRQLNRRIGERAGSGAQRESVPMRRKFSALPASKYWRIPLAYAGVL